MAASHFSEPRVNSVSQLSLLLSTVHVAALGILLNCCLQIGSDLMEKLVLKFYLQISFLFFFLCGGFFLLVCPVCEETVV